MPAQRATEKQIAFIQSLQRKNGFRISSWKSLEVMTKATASSWIAALQQGHNPKTESVKALSGQSSNPYVRAENVKTSLALRGLEQALDEISK